MSASFFRALQNTQEIFFWNDEIWKKIAEDKNVKQDDLFNKAVKKLNPQLENVRFNQTVRKNLFFNMHNILESTNHKGFTSHFIARFALWSNLLFCFNFLASLTLGLILFQCKTVDPILVGSTILLYLLTIFSYWQSQSNFQAYYEVVLRTYVYAYQEK